MDNGQPDAKRVRMNSGSWPTGHPDSYPRDHRALPRPPPYPPQHIYTQPPSQMPPHPQDDRRHHEPDYPKPVQEPHRPHAPVPPYHTPFTGPGPREALVKRDPSEDAILAHTLRAHSTGDIHQEHAPPPSPDDHRHQSLGGYEGLNPPPPLQAYRPASNYPGPPPQPQIPMYDRQPFDPPPTPGGPRDPTYPSIPYSSGSSNQRSKKTPRTSQACAQCRAAKGKCDTEKPCSACKDKGIKCEWQPAEPKQSDRIQMNILNTLQLLVKRVDKLEKSLTDTKPGLEADVKLEDGNDEMSDGNDAAPGLRSTSSARRPSSADGNYTLMDYDYGISSPKLDTDEEDTGKPIVPNDPAIPDGHTTAAAKLLRWRAIDALIGDKLREDKINDRYPSLKESKHSIRVWGRGPTQAPSPAESTGEDSYTDLYSPSPKAENVYGQLGGGTPPAHYRREGDPMDDLLDLTPSVVKRLTESYMKHMHIMHPILNPQKLEVLTNALLNTLPIDNLKSKVPPPGFVGHAGEHPAKKQKRSPSSLLESAETLPNVFVKPGALQPSIKTAIVLLVLGLGEIVEHKTKIPDLVPDSEGLFDSPSARNGWQSPVQAPSIISSNSSGLPSPQEGDRTSRNPRRTSVDGHNRHRMGPQRRNMDVIPGMKYIGPATDIIGNELGNHTLQHVHAYILASLYFGQIARPFQSHIHITNAGTSLLIMLKLRDQNLAEIRKESKFIPEEYVAEKNPIAFAFWTTLQLESDIVAELDLTHSGISTIEDSIPWPNLDMALKTKQISDEHQVQSYLGQLYLRNHLNTIHKEIYSAGQEDRYKLEIYINRPPASVDHLVQAIPSIEQIAPLFAWKDNNGTPKDILSARLRAKFHGTEVITYRPFLMMVMNRDSRFSSAPEEQIPQKVMDHAIACIRAMVNSTKVFYGMPPNERLIITNPWGTAHAQFGNVLVLQAAYNDPLLKPYVDHKTLKTLVAGTLKFLNNVADRDSSLHTDIKILRYAARKLNLLDSPDAHMSTSFSSATTAPATHEGTPLQYPLS